MRIRNKRKFELYLPYAGQKRGAPVGPGKLSMELPTERYFDPLLQRDWRAGKIDVLLNETDQIVLGPVTKTLKSEVVDVPEEALAQPVTEPAQAAVDAKTGEQVQEPPPAKPAPKPRKRKAGKKTAPKDAPARTINQRTDVIRMNRLAAELGVTPKSILARMKQLGLEAKGPMMNVPKEHADAMREHFKKIPRGSPALDPHNGLDRTGRKVTRFHEVPAGTPGAPRTAAAPGAPSLEDLQKDNKRLGLGTPKFGSGPGKHGGRIEAPGASRFGSTLSDGTPRAQRAQAAADAAAARGE